MSAGISPDGSESTSRDNEINPHSNSENKYVEIKDVLSLDASMTKATPGDVHGSSNTESTALVDSDEVRYVNDDNPSSRIAFGMCVIGWK